MTARRNSSADAPLLAWGEALRARKSHRARLRRQVVIATAGLTIVTLSAVLPPAPRLVWNASASAPIGLYAVSPGAFVSPGDMVVAKVPERFRQLAAERRYLPLDVPLVKRVAAYAGDDICAQGTQIFIDGRLAAIREPVDGRGRPMPFWAGCIRLRGRQVFLLMNNPSSFDGRYFGVTDGADLVGKARLLWRR